MTQTTDIAMLTPAIKQAIAEGIHYLLAYRNKGTYSVSFWRAPSLAGYYVYENYGVEGIQALNSGKSKILELRTDNSKPGGITMIPVLFSVEIK
jgi:hypothetical protein